MENESCPQEAAVLAAHRAGRLKPPPDPPLTLDAASENSLATHLDSCTRCQEAVHVAMWMRTLAAATPKQRALPDPDLVWIKSRLFGRQEAMDRVLRPLAIGETLGSAVVAAFAAAWLALRWPEMQAFLLNLWTQAGGAEGLAQAPVNPWPLTLVSLGGALILAAVVLAVHPLLTRN